MVSGQWSRHRGARSIRLAQDGLKANGNQDQRTGFFFVLRRSALEFQTCVFASCGFKFTSLC